MKTARLIVAALAVGFAFGWFTLRIPSIVSFRESHTTAGYSVNDYIKMIASPEEVFGMANQMQTMAQSYAMGALRSLESNEMEQTEKFLASQLSSHYYMYGPPDNPKRLMNETRLATLQAIESAMERHPALKEKIEERERSRRK